MAINAMKNSNLQCKVGDRIECGKYYGTIKYIGQVEEKPGQWLGIDWDIPERGKHNGNVNGKQYFTARHSTSGSFVRPEKANFGKSAIDSIETRYGEKEDELTAKINQQQQLRLQQHMNAPFLEMVGFDKVFSKQSDLSSLRVVNLREQNIHSAGPFAALSKTCPNIEELDLSKNLISSWKQVFEICEQLPKLNCLNVSENLMVMPETHNNYKFPQIKTLICGHMELTWDSVCQIGTCFTAVEEFRLPFNKIQTISAFGGLFQLLKVLDIEGNPLEGWPEILNLNPASNLEELNLENTSLKYIKFEDGADTVQFQNLKRLCLVNNLITDWISIGELNRLKNMESLKFLRNPVLDKENQATWHQIIIARIANLKILNGVKIEPNERRGAEYDYIKKYGLQWLKVKGTEEEATFLKEHTRYLELIQRHGEAEKSELEEKSKIIQNSLVELDIVYETKSIRKKLPPTLIVQKLEMLIQKLFRLGERPELTYISNENPDIHIKLDDAYKEIGVFSMQDGDHIIVNT